MKLYAGASDKAPVIPTSAQSTEALNTLAPHTEVSLGKTVTLPITMTAVDDYGANRNYTLEK
ncbi:hypothetical protein [Proteus vulgaris]